MTGPDKDEPRFGKGSVSLGSETWRVSNTGRGGHIYLRAAAAGAAQPVISYPVSVAEEIRDALTEAIEDSKTRVGTPA